MNVKLAGRMNAFQESIFAELSQLKQKKINNGHDIIDLSIGSPDLPPPAFVMEEISKLAMIPEMFGYSLKGTNDFKEAVSHFYARSYSVEVDKHEGVALLMGSQDGLVHIPMIFCEPGDYLLVPDPGYTAYATSAAMAGVDMYPMPLKKENGFLPDFNEIPKEICEKATMMILNFPGNPVPAMANKEFFEKTIQFAKQHNIIVLHDFAYSELYFDEENKPISFLSVDGAMDVGFELNSLSKTFSMAGCRVAYVVGNKKFLKLIDQFKSNVDYGVFFPVQAAAVKALKDESQYLFENRNVYRKRRDVLIAGLKEIGWEVSPPSASMFAWAEIPQGFQSSKEFAIELIEKANVVVTPGSAFGAWGEGYVRIALVQSEEKLLQAIKQIDDSGILKI